ncbi:hypothetical protein GCM10022221_67380 [Actinocorallia aurea]
MDTTSTAAAAETSDDADAVKLVAFLDMDGEFRVHREGCADLRRMDVRQADFDIPVKGSAFAIAEDLMSDIIDEGGISRDEAIAFVRFFPCCGSLPQD